MSLKRNHGSDYQEQFRTAVTLKNLLDTVIAPGDGGATCWRSDRWAEIQCVMEFETIQTGLCGVGARELKAALVSGTKTGLIY
jgi:hypothetical protein